MFKKNAFRLTHVNAYEPFATLGHLENMLHYFIYVGADVKEKYQLQRCMLIGLFLFFIFKMLIIAWALSITPAQRLLSITTTRIWSIFLGCTDEDRRDNASHYWKAWDKKSSSCAHWTKLAPNKEIWRSWLASFIKSQGLTQEQLRGEDQKVGSILGTTLSYSLDHNYEITRLVPKRVCKK